MSELEGAFIQVILESWRFAKGYSKLVEKLDLLERQKYRGGMTGTCGRLPGAGGKGGVCAEGI